MIPRRVRTSIIFQFVFSILVVLVLLPSWSYAKDVTFQREYVYKAGEADSKLSCRTISLEQVKRLLLEELGSYLESRTELRNMDLTRDQITILTAGVTQTEILEERWDGSTYVLIAKITADPKEVAERVRDLRKDDEAMEELEQSRLAMSEALKEIEKLKKELSFARIELNDLKEKRSIDKSAGEENNDREKQAAGTDGDESRSLAKGPVHADQERKVAQYQRAIRGMDAFEWFEKGYALKTNGKYTDAVEAFSKAIELKPGYEGAYIQRGKSYLHMGEQEKAINDADKVLGWDSNNHKALYLRGKACWKAGNKRLGRVDIERAAGLGNGKARAFLSRKGIL